MKTNRIKTSLLSLALIGAIMAGCAGGSSSHSGGTAHQETPAGGSSGERGASGRLYTQTHLIMSASDYAVVKEKAQTSLTARGFRFDDAAHSLTGPKEPLGSVVVQAGGVMGVTDSTGLLKLPAFTTPATEAVVKKNLGDDDQITFASSKLGPLDGPTEILIERNVDLATFLAAMDGDAMKHEMEEQMGRDASDYGPDCGATNECCQDYNGVISAPGKPRSLGLKLVHFAGSTCDYWVGQFVCAKLSGTDEGQCLQWHKGRWCQQIDDNDFSATPSRTRISVGDTVDIALHNNTRNNESLVELLTDEGTLECANVAGTGTSGKSVNCAFYEAGPTWKPDRTVTYRAPASLPAGTSMITAKVRVHYYGGSKDIFIEVCD